MPQFLVAIQHTKDYELPAGAEGEAMMREIGALNREMIAAGVLRFRRGPARSYRFKSENGS